VEWKGGNGGRGWISRCRATIVDHVGCGHNRGDRPAVFDQDGDLPGQPGHPDQLLEPQASLSDREFDPAANRRCWFSHIPMMRRGYDKNAWAGAHPYR
jgi:hypothetical protein